MRSESVDTSGIRFPPPFLYVGFFLVAWGIDSYVPSPAIPRLLEMMVGGPLMLAGLALILISMVLFFMNRTSPLPMDPTSQLVFSGPYRFTRNPMYLGMLCLYLGLGLWMSLFWSLALALVLVPLVNRLIIAKEEAYLLRAFGDDYRTYLGRVRRWI